MEKRIAIFGKYLLREKRTGIEVYAKEIIDRLLAGRGATWKLIMNKRHKVLAEQKYPGVEVLSVGDRLPKNLICDIPRMVRRGDLDAFFNPSQYTYFGKSQISVGCAFDVAWRFYPQYFPLQRKVAFEALTRYLCSHCRKIICISKSTMRDLVRFYRCPEDKLVLAYPGYDTSMYSPASQPRDAEVLLKYGVRRPYILYLGTLQRRKNVETLVAAFDRMKKRDVQLVLAGAKGWFFEAIAEKIDASPRKKAIQVIGFVEDIDKPAMYRNAAAFVNLSLYEGFGIPVLEAIASGAPAIIANASSFPEIVDNEHFLVDARNANEVAERIDEIVEDGKEKHAEYFAQRVRNFSWNHSAEKVREALEEVAGR